MNQNEENIRDSMSEQSNSVDEEEEQNRLFQLNFIQKLKSNSFIFIKDYLNQKTDENNLKYLKWLQSLYKKIYFTNDEKPLIKIKVRSKCKVSDYQAIYKQLKNNLFTCINPECKSIIIHF